MFYFNGQYSHAVLKVPKASDFRVQEEFGSKLHRVEPEPSLRDLGAQTIKALPERPLYARLDYVRSADCFQVMEVELIEPSLYFNMDENSPERFVDAFCQKYGAGAC